MVAASSAGSSRCRLQLIDTCQTRQARESGRARPGLESAPCAEPRPHPVASGRGLGLSGGAGAQRARPPVAESPLPLDPSELSSGAIWPVSRQHTGIAGNQPRP